MATFDPVLGAPDAGWTCFHCGERFGPEQEEEARIHFGPDQEWPALCTEAVGDVWLRRKVRTAEMDAREAVCARVAAEDAEDMARAELSSLLTNFKGARHASDVWNEYHVMEGRALAAEALAGMLRKADPDLYLLLFFALTAGEPT